MAKGMRTNSPISDPEPLLDVEPTTPKVAQKKDDWTKLAQATDYPQVEEHLLKRRAYYQTYLPGGTPIKELPADERSAYWQAATVIIEEIDGFLGVIASRKQKRG